MRSSGFRLGMMMVLLSGLAGAQDLGELRDQLRALARADAWADPLDEVKLERRMLADAIERARVYYLAQQSELGIFSQEQNVIEAGPPEHEDPIHQALALWGLANLNLERPTVPTARAAIQGLQFFIENSRPLGIGHFGPLYPGTTEISTATVAFAALALVDLWRGEERYLTRMGRGLCSAWATNYLNYLGGMEMDNGSWGRMYRSVINEREPIAHPYHDGAALLAYCRAARYMDREDLIPRIETIAPRLVRRYTVDVWRTNLDSEDTRAFFQWGSLALLDYVEAGWEHAEMMGDACLALAWWQLRQRRTVARGANSAFALEGYMAAYRVAELREDRDTMAVLRAEIERLLVRQIACQVGGPLEEYNHFLTNRRYRRECVGGIMLSPSGEIVRIDMMRHQVSAMLMALRLFYP